MKHIVFLNGDQALEKTMKLYLSLKEIFPNANISAFTATADKATREDIMEKLTNSNCQLVLQGFKRPNLSLSVYQKFNWKDQLLRFLSDERTVWNSVLSL